MTDSTPRRKSNKAATDKPKCPHCRREFGPDHRKHCGFPLYPHPSGKWGKKIRGSFHYFGAWATRNHGELVRVPGDGWEAALEEYKRQADDLHAGRTPRVDAEGLTVAELCDRFVVAKERLRDNRELAWSTWKNYKKVADRVVRVFGKSRLVMDLTADDFGALRAKIAKTRGALALGIEIQRTRTLFKFGFDEGLIDRPVRYGQQFNKPSKTVLRKAKAANGEKMLEPAALRELVDAASPQLKAMILLGLNCGMGNTDCSGLEVRHLDLEGGWLTYPREKTGVARRAKLWPETVEALRYVMAHRKEPKSMADAGAVFITKYRQRWCKTSSKGVASDAISQECRRLLDKTGHHQPGLGYYTMRHVFRTIADATRDFPAVRLVMGHADSSIDDVYRERIDDDRLEAVADHVHSWLFGRAEERQKTGATSATPKSSTQRKGSRPRLRLYAGDKTA